ncbi:hypothetical protein H6F32_00245 [Anabaena sp. FACHB-1237]|uniref:hypothetical protein n=1 Tax=Anabaena sp. FACHB-1237 TaxID=2692769 RepID=UPI001680C0D2|nr:hypothetical protein [Anabaena sp. FACHB-1237]MBD2136047.1 hypothetical protein [Anabaena sp. FACHB-1237]
MTNASNIPLEIGGNQEFRIIGPRRCGKTALMAALARWPNARTDSPILSIEPYNDEAGELISMAQDILEDGRELAGTRFEDIDEIKTYSLLITLKAKFLNHPLAALRDKPIRMRVSCREYSGELFTELRNMSNCSSHLSDYLDDCASASGLLILIDSTAKKSAEREYAQALDNLQRELNERLTINNGGLQNYRIAVVFTKCEQPPASGYWQNIPTFMGLNFPTVKTTFTKWGNTWGCSINYFFCSTFGTKGTPPKPNFKKNKNEKATYGVIDKPRIWRPLGLVAPLYWLATGKEDDQLRDTV